MVNRPTAIYHLPFTIYHISMTIPFIEENDQTRARHEHLSELRRLVGNVYPNKFQRSHVTHSPEGEDTITAIVQGIPHIVQDALTANFIQQLTERAQHGEKPSPEELERANAALNKTEVRLSGRIATPPRVMGKAAFVHLSDGVSRLQIYVRKADVRAINNDTGATLDDAEAGWKLFNLLDHGDFIGVAGYLFVTRTGELSVHVRELQFLSKALLPMPDKMHGISDPEIRQRQRYADLIAGSLKVKTEETHEEDATHEEELTTRQVFERRSKIIREMRRFLDDHGYIEVETPMLTPKATGAAAKPFKTHHNALDIDLYARIAPELYLKRLLVGGFERVYELNRNFRNEGISTRHNPEFTMLEFYCAYMDVNGMMDFCEEMLRQAVEKVLGGTTSRFENHEINFGRKFERLTMKDAIVRNWDAEYAVLGGESFNSDWLENLPTLRILSKFLSRFMILDILEIKAERLLPITEERAKEIEGKEQQMIDEAWEASKKAVQQNTSLSKESETSEKARLIADIFEYVEASIIQPTFITDFPKPISPLSKASPADPMIAERFELYIMGMECANGFSELNAPEEQYERFIEQMQQRERGDEEAMLLDEDYIRALSYGMPPAAGIGIGIDRLTMLLTNRHSIRDVILFPHMRPERKPEETTEESQK
jgi:lysyl-tRNA synthetase class 2